MLVVVAGGMIGVAARAALVLPLGAAAHPLVVPGVTLAINLVGSFCLGWVVGRLDGGRPRLRAFLGTGVLGGFTTYSAFAVQTVQVTGAAPVVGILLAIAALLGGVVVATAGLAAGRRAGGRPGQPDAPEEAE
nr:CrcB family protein [Microbacterium ulmi]